MNRSGWAPSHWTTKCPGGQCGQRIPKRRPQVIAPGKRNGIRSVVITSLRYYFEVVVVLACRGNDLMKEITAQPGLTAKSRYIALASRANGIDRD